MKVLALKPRFAPRLGAGPQLVIALLVIGLFGAFAIEPTRQLLEQRRRISGMEQELSEIERSNSKLEARIERLQDPDYLEQRARLQVGLVRPGETTFIVMPPSRRAANRSTKKARAPEPAPPPEPGFIDGFFTFLGLS